MRGLFQQPEFRHPEGIHHANAAARTGCGRYYSDPKASLSALSDNFGINSKTVAN